jgi:hypothetical protein
MLKHDRFQNKRQSFRQTRTNNAHAVAAASVSVVHHTHHHQHHLPHHLPSSSSSSSGHISTQQQQHPSSYGNDGGFGGPGTYGSIQLSSPPGAGPGSTAATNGYGPATNTGAGAGAYYSPVDRRGDDDYGNDTSTSRRYR